MRPELCVVPLGRGRGAVVVTGLVIVLLGVWGLCIRYGSAEYHAVAAQRVLVVGSELAFPPFAIVDRQGEADGFSVDLFKAVAQVMGFALRFRVGTWEEVRTALERGEIDALPLVSYSEEREKVFDFTSPYTVAHAAMFIRKGERGVEDDTELGERTILVMQADATHDYLVRRGLARHLLLVPTIPEALRLLASGKGDAALLPRLTGLLTARELHLTNIVTTGPRIEVHGRGFGFAVREGNSELLAQLNHGLSIVRATGTYDRLYDKWFGLVDPRGIALEDVYRYAIPLGGGAGVILGVALLWSWSLHREVQRRRRAECALVAHNRELLQTKQAAEAASHAKSVFLANMSHEWRTTLHTILGFARLLLRNGVTATEQQESLHIIEKSGQHLLDLVNDVLEISRIESGTMTLNQECVDLPGLLADMGNMMRLRATERSLSFVVTLSEDIPRWVCMDGGKWRQVLLNLLGNAIKFTRQGGVTMRVALQPAPMEQPDGKPMLICEVEDTGEGIAEQDMQRIFEPFIQVGHSAGSMEGTGLGLAISRHYLRLMGGELEATSQRGAGSLFRCRVPLVSAHQPEGVVQPLQPRVVGLDRSQPVPRILVADDLPEARLLLKKMLEEVGFQVHDACNGLQAVEVFNQWHPHLIWMDMRMPLMNGFEATKRIKATPDGRHTPVIALTASVFEQERQQVLEAGCDDYLAKPFREQDLFALMAKHLAVRYRYDQDVEPLQADTTAIPSPELSVRLAALSVEVQTLLRQSVSLLDVERMTTAVTRVQECDAVLAEALSAMIDGYQLEQLSRLVTGDGGAAMEWKEVAHGT
nr:Sensor protein [uncultured bacterium]